MEKLARRKFAAPNVICGITMNVMKRNCLNSNSEILIGNCSVSDSLHFTFLLD